MTVTNIVGPLMVYMDRFLIGAMISITAVAYYATPYEIATKLWIIPGAFMGVLFPAFASALAQDRARAVHLFNRAINYTFLSLFPIVLIIVTLAHEGLSLWLGSEFADNSSLVLQLLVLGVFINSLAHLPFGMVQSAGRPDLTAKLHMIEMPFYLLALWLLLGAYGIVGAAIAWVLRVTIDTLLLFVIVRWLLPSVSPFALQPMLITGMALFVLALGAIVPGLALKGGFLLLVLFLFSVIGWFSILTPDERHMICDQLKALPTFNWQR